MADFTLSIEERVDNLLKTAFNICFEDNPARVGWEFHQINTNIKITNPEYIKPDHYYLIDVYLTPDLYDNLYSIVEGFPMWLDTYRSGRSSIHNLLYTYTPEKLEEILNRSETELEVIVKERENFINKFCK